MTSPPPLPQRFGLPEAAIQAIQNVLASHPEVERAIVYGSRALGRQRAASDIDLTLLGPSIRPSTLAQIEAELDDLLLPWMIDLSCLADLSHPPLLAHIHSVGQVLYTRPETTDLSIHHQPTEGLLP
jgi:predicted nucleotidyltransferase